MEGVGDTVEGDGEIDDEMSKEKKSFVYDMLSFIVPGIDKSSIINTYTIQSPILGVILK